MASPPGGKHLVDFSVSREFQEALIDRAMEDSPSRLTLLNQKIREVEKTGPRFWLHRDPRLFFTVLGRLKDAWEVLRGMAYPEPF